MNNSRLIKVVVGALCASMVIGAIPLQNVTEKVNADTHMAFTTEYPENAYRSFEKHDYEVSVKTTSQWSGHSNLEFSFKNTGSETIHDWHFTFDFKYDIENPHNCKILEHKDTLYTIANNDWNQDIRPGEAVTIGFTAVSTDSSEITDMPSFFFLNTKTESVSSSDLSYRYEEYSNWTSGFNGALYIKNNTGSEMRDWNISFTANRSITQVDSASMVSHSNGKYVITNDGNNQNIAAKQEYRFGVQGGENDPSLPFELTNITGKRTTVALKLTDDKNKNGIADVLEMDAGGFIDVPVTPTSTPEITVTSTPAVTDNPTPTIEPTVTSTPVVTDVPTDTTTPTPVISVAPTNTTSVTPTVMPTDLPEDIDYETDTDGDMLPDDLEDYYGTDKNKKDTDGDGVSDFYEIVLNTDPLVADSNGSADFDHDGLSNAKESELGTNPLARDSDMDGLSDGEEVNLYGTNPLAGDTDGDGVWDDEELAIGKNPNSASDKDVTVLQTYSQTITNKEDPSICSVDIKMATRGKIDYVISVKDLYNKDVYSTDVYGRIGSPIGFTSSEEFEQATVTFHYDETKIGDTLESDLGVLWYDEESGFYIIQEQAVVDPEKDTITVDLEHFSVYVIVDLNKWLNPEYPDYSKYLFLVTYDDGGYWWEGREPTLDEYEATEFNWWRLMKGSDYKILQRLYGEIFEDHRTETLLCLNYKFLWLVINTTDSDEDGIYDFLEDQGVMGTNKHIYYADSKTSDKDGDGIPDGVELGGGGLFSFSNQGGKTITNCEKDIRGYTPNISGASAVYVNPQSNPTTADWDNDGATDDIDATPKVKNESINYILMGEDNGGGLFNNPISRMEGPYLRAFERLGEKVVVLKFHDGSDYQKRLAKSRKDCSSKYKMVMYAFKHLQCDLEADELSEEEKYKVTRVIIVAHGQPNWIQFGSVSEDCFFTSNDIRSMNVQTDIDIIDIQCCFCGLPTYYDELGETTCIAFEFARKNRVKKVYAWTGECSFDGGRNHMYINIFDPSSCGYAIYKEFYVNYGVVQHKTVKTDEYHLLLNYPLYAPLQY